MNAASPPCPPAANGEGSGLLVLADGRPLDVLVVDDEVHARTGLARAVGDLGHTCRVAKDGEDAWEKLRERPADVVLTDWRMPRADGIQLCRRIRGEGDEAPYTYVILMTAYADREHRLEGMRAGADDFLAKPVDLDELEARLLSAARITSLHHRLAERTRTLRRDSQSSFRIARIDPLTRIPNRLQLDEDLARLRGSLGPDCIAMCDVDRFKDYNDTFGHLAGDDVLRRVADAIRLSLRKDDAVYRFGGEEFVIALPSQRLVDVLPVLDRVRSAVERLRIPRGDGGVVTLSIGAAERRREDATDALWIARADAALYKAKHGGRNRVEVAT